MEKKKETTEKPKQKGSAFVKCIRNGGPIGANIYLGTTQDGYEYHYFQLSRAWKSSKQKESKNSNEFSYSDRFFPRNAEAIAKVSVDAAKECEKLDAELSNPIQKAAA